MIQKRRPQFLKKTMAKGGSKRYIAIFKRFVLLRIFVFWIIKNFANLYKFYLERIMNKPRSSRLFADETMAAGVVRLSILNGLGIPRKELRSKPFIGIANSWSEINPGHKHLKQLARNVKDGVLAAGGIPFEFNVPAPCDALGNANEGMRFILAQRDLIADIIETYVTSQWFDGMVTISSCDKINPGMLMAAARLDIPTICVPGGPNMMMTRFDPDAKGLDHQDYDDLQKKLNTTTCATCGSCELLTTANTMQILMEALGMALPGSACAPAFSSEKMAFAREAGTRIVKMIKEDLTPRKIMNRKALENAVMVNLAIGGSTNATLHLPAIANELDIEVKLDIFNHFNKNIPTICGIAPSGPHGVVDLYMAGGTPAVMKRLVDDLHVDCLNVSGKNLGEIIKEASIIDEKVIRPRENPFFIEGSAAILSGNLAPDGCVVKQSAVDRSMLKFEGKAKVFNSEADAMQAFIKGKIGPKTVVVIRYEGPKGGPGMPEMLSITGIMDIMGFKEVALITDGRFSGASKGPCIGHISPEAYDGGPVAAIQNDDLISIDIPGRSIEVNLTEDEISKRLEGFKPLEKEIPRGYMRRYRRLVGSASKGAVLQ